MITNASVKVMRSYDYCHFEVSLSIEKDNGIVPEDVDEYRKRAMRLVDKAVTQYQKSKDRAAKRTDGKYQMQNFEAECLRIQAKEEGNRTINEVAMLQEYKQEKWRERFKYDYDYEDEDDEYSFR